MRFQDNLLLLTDSYKISHWRQYPSGTERVYSYFESRGGRFNEVVFFGLQYVLRRYLEGAVVTREGIDQASRIWASHFDSPDLFYRDGFEHILEQHAGRLPVVIRAVPEGTPVPTGNVLLTIENTDPACYWLPNFLETLLVQVWYGCTVATLSREMKRLLSRYLEATGDPESLPFKLHDFGFRGVSSVESAAIGGAAHLVNFQGTDTMPGCLLAREYYDAEMPGGSIPAAEHSTITSWGRESEVEAFRNILEQFPRGAVACVSDSFDIFHACREHWGRTLRDQVLARDGTLVVRPDSGHPPEVVVQVLETLGEAFGTESNPKGYRVLPPQIRVIQGDGIDYEMASEILAAVTAAKWSVDNLTFGMGGALLQILNRDTQQFAMKCSETVVNGEVREVFKEPATDPRKNSKRGRLKLVLGRDGQPETRPEGAPGEDLLCEVFRDGFNRERIDFEAVRRNSAI
ncbi:nicotinate phosphoribosyltransferase [Myxococcota bacterium]|nr:nicotinate phosphoribosyltransferase [Myxococcota bacterium]